MIEVQPQATWSTEWVPDAHSVAEFSTLAPGVMIAVVKRAPDGTEATRYPARVVESSAPAPWIELVADWSIGRVEVAGLVFETGDTIREFFSAEHPYNAFAVIAPDGTMRGWYGNVTYPAFFDTVNGERVLVWHDLYLDVVILADGSMHLLDDDELAASDLPATNPDLCAAIVQAREDLIDVIPHLIP